MDGCIRIACSVLRIPGFSEGTEDGCVMRESESSEISARQAGA
jgi:hypothetical protein